MVSTDDHNNDSAPADEPAGTFPTLFSHVDTTTPVAPVVAEPEQDEETDEADEATAPAVAAPSFGLLFQAPDLSKVPERPRRKPARETGSEEEAEDNQSGRGAQRGSGGGSEGDSDNGSGNGPDGGSDGGSDGEDDGQGGRRRRRRGGKGRRGRSDSDGGEDQQGGSEDAGDGEDSRGGRDRQDGGDGRGGKGGQGDQSDKDGGSGQDDQSGGDDDGDGSGSSRRRRRRRRGEESESGNRARGGRARSAQDEVSGVRGSTRLEAKRQRRREGREAGRRRTIITEAEFLARRESVERVMVVRGLEDRTQIGVLEDGVLVEHYVSRETQTTMVGNVYLGRVQNVLPSMEAAFVDIGKGRNAVLYAGEVNWDAAGLDSGEPKRIENALKSGESVLVQVTKDPIGHKGARLTSQVSLPGRYLVYVPGNSMTGISRKLPDTERARLKQILKEVVPQGAGVIVRTAAEGASEEELRADVERLTSMWERIQAKEKTGNAPVLLHGEPDMTVRVIRDVFNEDFTKLVVSGEQAWTEVSDYIADVAPDLADRLEKWDGEGDIFTAHRVHEALAKAMDRKVWLPSGGSLVIDRTEAMTVVDVNTGKFVGSGGNLEETVTKNNIEAAEEIVRQLRLRDIGGIIVIDFIDMVLESNRDLVVRRLLECLGRDRTKHQVAEVTSLGLVQMTRKRVGAGLIEVFSETCTHCAGRGIVVHPEPIEKSGGGSDHGGGRGRGNGGGRGRSGGSGNNGGNAAVASRPQPNPSGPTPAQIAAAAHAAAQQAGSKADAGAVAGATEAAVEALVGPAATAADTDATAPSGEDRTGPAPTGAAAQPESSEQAAAPVAVEPVAPVETEPVAPGPLKRARRGRVTAPVTAPAESVVVDTTVGEPAPVTPSGTDADPSGEAPTPATQAPESTGTGDWATPSEPEAPGEAETPSAAAAPKAPARRSRAKRARVVAPAGPPTGGPAEPTE
ncbi:hypothetical protein GCM10009583_13210 [Ornithinicoccus hortensis]|uniref:ribonuclease E/G n=1 Tax=Ornithinicoccus hortensis TaxID=82346 RepID=UPI0031D84552